MLAMLLPGWFRPVPRTEADWQEDIVSGRAFAGRPADAVVTPGAPGWRSNRFTLGGSFMYVPYRAKGALLEADIWDASGFRVATVRHAADSGADVGFWRLDIRGWRGFTAQIRASPAGAVSWLSKPILSARSVASLPPRPVPVYLQTNYIYYFASFLGVAAMLFIPGAAARRWRPEGLCRSVGYLPLPGLGLMAAAGLVSYALGPARGEWAGKGLLVLEAILAATIVFGRRRAGGTPVTERAEALGAPKSGEEAALTGRCALLCYAALVLAVVLDSAIRTPMGEDFWAGSSLQARMAASPPDSTIPYKTAAYLTLPNHTPALSERFFWKGWSARSRGPLMPLIILGEFGLAPPKVQSGGDAADGPWPAAIDSFYLARFIGILTNACVLLAAADLLSAMGVAGPAYRCALLWLTLAPVTWINVAFVWPKLLATYFLLLATAAVFQDAAAWVVGLLLAASYYAHPIGALFALPLLLLARRTAGAGAALRAAAAAALACAPWWWLKHHAHQPDPFLRYAAGDGRGPLPAASLGSWLMVRAKNLYYTLVPGAWFRSAAARAWRHGELPPLLAWSVHYSKTLPAELGYACAWIPFVAFKRVRTSALFCWFLLPGFLLALAYWGYSDDGLGRNCLEPVTVGLIIWAGSAWPLSRSGSRLVLALLCLETLFMTAAGMAGASTFSASQLPAITFGLFAAAAVIFALPLVLI